MIIALEIMMKDMKSILINLSINLKNFTLPDSKIMNQLSGDIIKSGYLWVFHIHEHEYRDLKRTKGLLSEEVWNRYFTWKWSDDTREMKMLRDDIKNLRSVWHVSQRPEIFCKGKIKEYLKAKKSIERAERKLSDSKSKV